MAPVGRLGHLRTTKVHFYKLYRAILRSHKMLPYEMKDLGDKFVKSEFRDHKDLDSINDELIRKFFTEWTLYLNQMIEQSKLEINNKSNISSFGKPLDITQMQGMSSDQLNRLESFWEISDEFTKNINNQNNNT